MVKSLWVPDETLLHGVFKAMPLVVVKPQATDGKPSDYSVIIQ